VRIVGGAWRGRTLVVPKGRVTRPTSDRVRQALFDTLLHASWGGRDVVDGAAVLDAFAGTGALGLEAVSRGAGTATFFDIDAPALAAIRQNIASCRAEPACRALAADATKPPRGAPCRIVFLDPPYAEGLVPRAVAALTAAGWIAPQTLIVAEFGREEALPEIGELLDDRAHGAARVAIWRAA
jgi:16S rRNA (guanine966-N2)-methyltransferase